MAGSPPAPSPGTGATWPNNRRAGTQPLTPGPLKIRQSPLLSLHIRKNPPHSFSRDAATQDQCWCGLNRAQAAEFQVPKPAAYTRNHRQLGLWAGWVTNPLRPCLPEGARAPSKPQPWQALVLPLVITAPVNRTQSELLEVGRYWACKMAW